MSTHLASFSQSGLLAAPRKNHIALEMIEFQDSSFGEDLEKIISEIHTELQPYLGNPYLSRNISNLPEIKKLEKLVFNRLGLKIELITDEDLATVICFYSNKNHVFLKDHVRGNIRVRGQEKILARSIGKKGTVDTRKAKVSGIFSEYNNLIFMNFVHLFGVYRLTIPEVTAVLLHEIGHAFYACEYSDRLESTNQILADVGKIIFSTKEKKDVSYVFREIEKVNPKITIEEVDKLITGDKVIAGTTWFKVVVNSVQEQLKNAKYSETSSEALADNFAARFGYSRAVVTSLDKMSLLDQDIEKSKFAINFMGISEAIASVLLLTGIAAGFFSVPFSLIVTTALVGFTRSEGEDFEDYTYDSLKVRYQRVRSQLVEALKNKHVPKDVSSSILDDIRIIDRCIEETGQKWSVLKLLANFVVPSAKKAKDSIAEQQLLEELAFNDLFVKSAELRVNS